MAVSDYRKPQNQLIYDLIEESNPGFKNQYPLGSLKFQSVSAITVDSADPYKRDTKVICSGTAGSGIIGNVTFKYRRIDISALFRGMTVKFDTWVSGGSGLVRANWIASLNSKFGVSVQDSDFDTQWSTMQNGTTYNIPIVATSLCYKGTFTGIGWVQGKRPLSNMFPTDASKVLATRLYPGGNDFTTPGRKPQGEWQTYGMDASPIKTYNDWGTSGSVPAPGNNTTGFQAILRWLNNNTGRTNWSNQDASVEGGICGIPWYTYTLPSASVPEANSARYNRVTVLQSKANSWFAGKILLHWNV